MVKLVDASYTRQRLGDGRTKVLNVLSRDSYREKHIPGTLNLPEDDPEFERLVAEAAPDRGQPVIVHCSSNECQASTRAARRIEGMGYADVSDFKAGLQGWEQAGYRFEQGARPPRPSRKARETPPRPGREEASRREEPRAPETR